MTLPSEHRDAPGGYAATLKAGYAARRARLFAGPPKLPALPPMPKPEPEPVPDPDPETVSAAAVEQIEPDVASPAGSPVPVIEVPTAIPLDAYGCQLSPADRIILEVSEKYNVTPKDIRSPRRDRQVVPARHEAAWRMKHETEMSLPQIGRKLGDRDHTTVLHSIRKHEKRLELGDQPELPLPRPSYARGGWSEDQEARLIALRDQGLSFTQIAKAMGGTRSGDAVKNRYYKLEADADRIAWERLGGQG